MEEDQCEYGTMDRVRLGIVCAGIVAGAAVFSVHLTSFIYAKLAVYSACTAILGIFVLLRASLPLYGLRAYAPFLLAGIISLFAGQQGYYRFGLSTRIELLRCLALLLFALCAFDLFRHEHGRRAISKAIVISAALVAALAFMQRTRLFPGLFPDYGGTAHPMYSVFGNPGLMGGYLAAAIPLSAYSLLSSARLKTLDGLCFLLICGAVMISESRSAWLAAAAGCLYIVLTSRGAPRRVFFLGCTALAIAVVSCLLAPDLTIDRMLTAFSADDEGQGLRLWFWQGALQMIQDHPIFGVGPGNFAYWSPSALAHVLWQPGGEGLVHNTLHTLHAHCDWLEIAAEVGLVGTAPLLWWWARLVRCRGPEWGVLVALVVFSLFYFPFYCAPHAVLGLLAGGMLFAGKTKPGGAPDTNEKGRGSRIVALMVGVCGVATLPLVLWMVILPSLKLRHAEDLHIAGEPSLLAYERAAELLWAPPEVYEKFGSALLDEGRYLSAWEAFETARRDLDTGAVYLGLGVATWKEGDSDAARAFLEDCVYRWPSYAPAWQLLTRVTPPEARDDVLERASRWLDHEDLAAVERERIRVPAGN